MNFKDFQIKSKEIVNESLEELESILNEVEMLDPIIQENQISDFIKVWLDCVANNISLQTNFLDDSFNIKFISLISRMNEQNKIKERVIELSDLTNLKINSIS